MKNMATVFLPKTKAPRLSDRIDACIEDADDVIQGTWPGVRKMAGLLGEVSGIVKAAEAASDRDSVYLDCINAYGGEAQELVAIEGMAELTKALLKGRRWDVGVMPPGLLANIIDGIADVRIMCRQLEIMHDISAEVEERIAYKTERQRKRLEGRGRREGDVRK